MLALHGFDAYGLEISETAVKEAEVYASAQLKNPSGYNFGSEQHRSDSRGSATFLKGDFFSSEWDFKQGIDESARFDLAYDYTVSSSPLHSVRGVVDTVSVPMCSPPGTTEGLGKQYGTHHQARWSAYLS